MALAPLAVEADLLARGVTIPSGVDPAASLAAASDAIRDAAGSAITLVETTLELPGSREQWLVVPLQPLRTVTAVRIDGDLIPATDWKIVGGALWRSCGWQSRCSIPSVVSLDLTAGLDEAPADIVDLCCSLAAASLAAIEDGYDPQRGLMNFSVDDYREGYAKGEDEVINPLDLPDRTRRWLRDRFGTSVGVVGTYS